MSRRGYLERQVSVHHLAFAVRVFLMLSRIRSRRITLIRNKAGTSAGVCEIARSTQTRRKLPRVTQSPPKGNATRAVSVFFSLINHRTRQLSFLWYLLFKGLPQVANGSNPNENPTFRIRCSIRNKRKSNGNGAYGVRWLQRRCRASTSLLPFLHSFLSSTGILYPTFVFTLPSLTFSCHRPFNGFLKNYPFLFQCTLF